MKNIALFESSGKVEALKCAEKTAGILKQAGAACFAVFELAERFSPDIRKYIKICNEAELEKYVDVVISFGGDGTMLGAARLMINSGIPIMGVNVGRLGFLAEFSVKEIDSSIYDLLHGNYRIVDRSVLETEIDNEMIFALNDFVVEKKDTSRMISFEIFTNKHLVCNLRSDGIILTTPTGSTAYSLSCGGPILAPSTEVLCLTPISPHTLTMRPLVIPDKNDVEIMVTPTSGETILVADGQVMRVLGSKDAVVIRKSANRVKLIKPLKSSYYDLLREKLLWSVNAENSKSN